MGIVGTQSLITMCDEKMLLAGALRKLLPLLLNKAHSVRVTAVVSHTLSIVDQLLKNELTPHQKPVTNFVYNFKTFKVIHIPP